MKQPKWCMIFDFHTMPGCPDVGRDFDFERLGDRLQACGVDYVIFPARCNLGLAYYPTAIGIQHPTLQRDLLGEFLQACRKRGIGFGAYINGGLSHEEGLRHRDWLTIRPDGRMYGENRMDNFFREMCYNSGYGDHINAMVDEVLERYPVDGFFFDCLMPHECIGYECVREMKQEGIDPNDPEQRYAFALRSVRRFIERLTRTVRSHNSASWLYFNGVPFEEQAEFAGYFDLECLPTGGWGYEVLPLCSRYVRTLGKPAVNMSGRFHESWGDFGGLRTLPSLEYDLVTGLANTLACSVGDHLHPRGDFSEDVFELVGTLYRKLQRYQPWYENARAVTDMALLVPRNNFSNHGERAFRGHHAMTGMARMLCELKQQFDVITEAGDLSKYRLLILPDELDVDEKLANRLEKFLAQGGQIIAGDRAGLKPDHSAFALPGWGVNWLGTMTANPCFLRALGKYDAGLPAMPSAIYEPACRVEAAAGTETIAAFAAPLVAWGWDGEHGNYYTPPGDTADTPAATRTKQVTYFAFPIGLAYTNHAPLPLRQLLSNVLADRLPRPLVRSTGLPSFGRITVTEQPELQRRNVHVMAYVPERRGNKIDMIEDYLTIHDITVELRLDDRTIRRVVLAPEETPLAWRCEDGYCRVELPALTGYALIAFEFMEVSP